MKGNNEIKILSAEELEHMRVVGRLGREVLDEAARIIKPGVTCDEIDRVVHEASVARNCYPSPLNYHKFPKSCCTSPNEVICHGIPDMRSAPARAARSRAGAHGAQPAGRGGHCECGRHSVPQRLPRRPQ